MLSCRWRSRSDYSCYFCHRQRNSSHCSLVGVVQIAVVVKIAVVVVVVIVVVVVVILGVVVVIVVVVVAVAVAVIVVFVVIGISIMKSKPAFLFVCSQRGQGTQLVPLSLTMTPFKYSI